MILAAFLTGLSFSVVKETVLPGLARERKRIERMVKGDEKDNIRDLDLITDGRGHLFLINEYDITSRVASNVDVMDAGDPGRHLGYVSAMRYAKGPGGRKGWYPLRGSDVTHDLDFPLDTDLTPRDLEIASPGLRHLSVEDLRHLIARKPHDLDLQLRMHEHFAYPLGGVILLLLGLPLVLRGGGKSPYMAVGMSLLLSVGWFALAHLFRRMGATGDVIDPLLGAWLPVLLFGSLGLVLFESIRT